MFCPVCGIGELQVKNNTYYCPHCKIYIGNNPTGLEEKIQPIDTVVNGSILKGKRAVFLEKWITNVTVLFFLGLAIIALINNFYYFDFSNKCVVFLNPALMQGRLSTGTIKEMITIFKNESYKDYKDFCKYVKQISSVNCKNFDAMGCYVQPDTISMSSDGLSYESLFLTLLAHENCHSQQFHKHRPAVEEECGKRGMDFINFITQQ